METRSKKRKINYEVAVNNRKTRKLKSQSHTCRKIIFDFNSLPDPVLLRIFRYLTIPIRWSLGRVCKKWYKISRDPDPIFWEKLEVGFDYDTYDLKEPTKLIEILPESVIFCRILFDHDVYEVFDNAIHFGNFFAKLRERCPNLQTLIFEHATVRDGENSHVTYLCNILPKNLKILELHLRTIGKLHLKFQDSYTSNIEVFDISWSDIDIDPLMLLQMPRLRELYLAGQDLKIDFFNSIHSVISNLEILDLKDTFMRIDIFQVVLKYGLNLTQLYVCYTDLVDEDFGFVEEANVLPHLKTLCVRGCSVTYRRINSLINCKLSLERVYVGDLNDSDLYNSVFDYSRCASTKVIICDAVRSCCDRKKRGTPMHLSYW